MTEVSFTGGLVPAIVQHDATGAVLMLAYMNEAALDLTQTTGFVHFWSRSRQEIWKKGATSGSLLRVRSIEPDCDGDTLLIQVIPDGPACHTGRPSCFGGSTPAPLAVLSQLDALIRRRARELPADSYTAHLIRGGPEAIGRKLVEEATETLLAAKDHAEGAAPDRRVAEEAADLTYHLLVALAERGVPISAVTTVLAERGDWTDA